MTKQRSHTPIRIIIKVLLTLIIIAVLTAVLSLVGCAILISAEISAAEEVACVSDLPEGTYTVKFYLWNGGATTSYRVRATVTDNTAKRPNERQIYFQYGTNSTDIEWISEHNAVINRVVSLDVRSDCYDYRDGDMMKYPTSYIHSSESPNREYVINFYRYTEVGEKIRLRAEAVNTKDKTKRDVYYVYTEGKFKKEVEWLSEYEVKLNGIQLDLRHDEYIKVDR